MKVFNKRITILAGHYGSGKTQIAVNGALELRRFHDPVALADLDIVNPYFRSGDFEGVLTASGVRLISSALAGSNVESAGLPPEAQSVLDDASLWSVVDVGGDDRGAIALGRYAARLAGEAEVCFVLSRFRPMTATAALAAGMMDEIERACGLKFTSVIHNSNLGRETAAADVLGSMEFIDEFIGQTGLSLLANTADERLAGELLGKVRRLWPIRIFSKEMWRVE